jgi:opacity protein-like surface antigen
MSMKVLACAALAAPLMAAAPAAAQFDPIQGSAGHLTVDFRSGQTQWGTVGTPRIPGDVYSNIGGTANFGFSSTDFNAVWGDRIQTTGTGTLDQADFTVFNASTTGAGPLLTGTFVISFVDAVSLTTLGSFSTNLTFGVAGLAPGFFTTVSVTGLGGLGINLSTTDILMTQQVTANTGSALRLGIASLNPITAGSSANTMFINASTVGAAGYYNIGNPALDANPGYRVNIPTPGTLGLLGLGGLVAMRRRR